MTGPSPSAQNYMRALLLTALFMALTGCQNSNTDRPGDGTASALEIDADSSAVILEGRIYPHRYNADSDRAQGHHAITWASGGRAGKALVEVETSDRETAKSLRALGAEPGRLLPENVWSERYDPSSPYPDYHAEGTLLEVELTWDGAEHWRPLAELLEDGGGQGLQIHFQGQEELIPVWNSGCVVCLASCPGAKASNARYTIRDQVKKVMEFRAKEEILPPDGTSVRVRLRMPDLNTP